MANRIGEGDLNLARVNYTSLLNGILEILGNTPPSNLYRFCDDGGQLAIDIDEIAYSLATTQASMIENPCSSTQGIRIATTNLTESSLDDFADLNRKIRDRLQEYLGCLLQDHNFSCLGSYLNFLCNNLLDFQIANNKKQELNFDYDFKKKHQGLSKQRLTLKHQDNQPPFLKFHRLTITIKDTKEKFDLQLHSSIKNYINTQFATDHNKDELEEILEDLHADRNDLNSDWYAIKRLMDTQAIARVQRTAKIKYLEYLLEHIGEDDHAIYLEILIHRLKELEKYLSDFNRTDGDYQVSYNSESFNIKEIFSRAEAFERLPIIPLVIGSLGESRDCEKEELNFTFGLKLKLDGKIQTAAAKSVLDYNLDLLNPDGIKHQEELKNGAKKVNCARRTIEIAVLYFFVFAGNKPTSPGFSNDSDVEYDVINRFEQKVLPKLKSDDEEEKRKLFKGIIEGIQQCQTEEKINKLRILLTTKLKTFRPWNSRVYPIKINLKKGVLETDAKIIDQRNTFFRSDLKEQQKKALKYIAVSDASIDNSSICHLSGDLKIKEINYYNTQDYQAFSMEYVTGKFPTIPIVLYPQATACNKIVNNNFKGKKIIQFSYKPDRLKELFNSDDNHNAAFIYRFVFSLLTYITIKNILDVATNNLKPKLFVPILMLHLGDKDEPREEEVFMRATFTSLCHLINANHRASTQGFSVKNINNYKIKNALSSLYNILPKKFNYSQQFPTSNINKLAIIVVASRECDRSWQGDYKISNLMGEIIKLDTQKDGSITIYTSKTISNNYNSDLIYQDLDILSQEVDRLYQEGYRHILYIAKSPYSQTLNLTASENDENLYFMSASVIRNFKGNKEDLKIYPVFFDKYYVVSLQKIGRKSLYIQDAEELSNIVEDPSKKVAVFFNLFNGIQIGKPEDRYYNGVISYSTLLNVYDRSIIDTGEIYADLINNDQARGIKTEILQLLTLFHFSRYEADSTSIQLKLDPYQNIIGDHCVGALAIFPHMQPKVQFNLLAFLNEVNDVLNANIK